MVLGGVRTVTLVKVAFGGGVICLGAAIGWMEHIQAQVRNTEPFQNAMRLFLGYKDGRDLLGEPVHVARLDLTSGGPNKITATKSQIVIPLKGFKCKGSIYAYSSRENSNLNTSWNVDRLDLEVDKPRMKWTFFKGHGFDLTPYDFSKVKEESSES